MSNFWQKLPKPFFILAPMEDVTDTVFRRVILECSRAEYNPQNSGSFLLSPSSLDIERGELRGENFDLDVLFTEFTNCEGIQSVGQSKLIHRLKFTEDERPIVAQVWGITPEDYFKTAKMVVEMGFDGMDINMGCPVKAVIKQGACSALIKNPKLAKEIVLAAKEGLGGKIPLSIKTRIGFSNIQTEEWCGFILKECRPAALTIHGRTVKEESKVPNHWEEIGRVVEMNEQLIVNSEELKRDKTLIIGNGDVLSLEHGFEYANKYKLDGIMIGRGVFKNPWIFNSNVIQDTQGKLFWKKENLEITAREKLQVLFKHADLFEKTWGNSKNYLILGKFLKIYVSGFSGSSELRNELNEFLSSYNKTREGNLALKIEEICKKYL